MPTYQFRCPTHGDFDAIITMKALTETRQCTRCNQESPRVYSGIYLNLGDQRARRIIDATKESSDHPPVVTSLPPRGRRSRNRITHHPLAKKLPRPE